MPCIKICIEELGEESWRKTVSTGPAWTRDLEFFLFLLFFVFNAQLNVIGRWWRMWMYSNKVWSDIQWCRGGRKELQDYTTKARLDCWQILIKGLPLWTYMKAYQVSCCYILKVRRLQFVGAICRSYTGNYGNLTMEGTKDDDEDKRIRGHATWREASFIIYDIRFLSFSLFEKCTMIIFCCVFFIQSDM